MFCSTDDNWETSLRFVIGLVAGFVVGAVFGFYMVVVPLEYESSTKQRMTLSIEGNNLTVTEVGK